MIRLLMHRILVQFHGVNGHFEINKLSHHRENHPPNIINIYTNETIKTPYFHLKKKSFKSKSFFDNARKMAALKYKMEAAHIGDVYYS